MKDVFVVIYATEKGNYGKVKGAFAKEEDAKMAAKGFGFWGSDGYVVPLSLYENIEEYENDK